MNLHGIVRKAIRAVNPDIPCQLYRSVGANTEQDGKRTPAYAIAQVIPCQIQAVTYNDIQMLDGLNIQGDRRAVYLNGDWNGVVRADRQGGDLLVQPDNTIWLVVFTFEQWPDWSKLAITRQLNRAIVPVANNLCVLGTSALDGPSII